MKDVINKSFKEKEIDEPPKKEKKIKIKKVKIEIKEKAYQIKILIHIII